MGEANTMVFLAQGDEESSVSRNKSRSSHTPTSP